MNYTWLLHKEIRNKQLNGVFIKRVSRTEQRTGHYAIVPLSHLTIVVVLFSMSLFCFLPNYPNVFNVEIIVAVAPL